MASCWLHLANDQRAGFISGDFGGGNERESAPACDKTGVKGRARRRRLGDLALREFKLQLIASRHRGVRARMPEHAHQYHQLSARAFARAIAPITRIEGQCREASFSKLAGMAARHRFLHRHAGSGVSYQPRAWQSGRLKNTTPLGDKLDLKCDRLTADRLPCTGRCSRPLAAASRHCYHPILNSTPYVRGML